MTPAVPRALVVWFPDWPLVAARLAGEAPEGSPAAVIDKGLVAVCSAEARSAGVARGLRVREAQARCAELVTAPSDPARDGREFEPVVRALEATVPGVDVLRPGLCAIRARGASAYYGGEEAAAGAALEAASGLGLEARAGIADSVFAAEEAARCTGELAAVRVVEPGRSAHFLAPLPVAALGDPRLASLLTRLGLRTLGDFASLPAAEVRSRFGPDGLTAHARAQGRDHRAVVPRVPPSPLDRVAEFEPGLARVDQIAFGLRPVAEDFIGALARAGLACTQLRVQITDDSGARSERSWGHPHQFSAADAVERVRWQLQSGGEPQRGHGRSPQWRTTGEPMSAPVVRVRLVPERVDLIGRRSQALFGGVDERLDHGLHRLQTMLGHGSVLHATAAGGRLLAERCLLVPWGEEAPAGTADRASRPWPGAVPPPLPATVFPEPVPVTLLGDDGRPLGIDPRGGLTAAPAWFTAGPRQARRAVRSWAGPWPLRERWWDAAESRRAERFQILDGEGQAWLLLGEGGGWWAEARYD
ncbi:DNA polymerase [Sinomonas cellulolyticus]|uniref:DNA polymerase Y family protein n=1 Tax=Sinomonas cellulolyticus TaxID=2801916 RepID=A0ABS1JY43_9MICC|nr:MULTISPECIES: DNA polymerase Y family protein [Sinomonas]MBL0704240.1 DNA polymerase Y family protein [Sinomonas cellulolyticus]GHG58480.1 DNA polymerase [Sinomonas sp. KCTC 49339]